MITHRVRDTGLTLVRETLLCVMLMLGAMLLAVLRYSASLQADGRMNAFTTAGGTLAPLCGALAYGGVCLWLLRRASPATHPALSQGALLGVVLGLAAIVSHSLEVFATLSPPLGAVVGVGMWGVRFVSFAAAGSATYRRVGSLGQAALSSVWCAVVSTSVLVLYGFIIVLGFMPHMQSMLAEADAQYGPTISQAFVIQNTLSSALTHLLLAPAIALLFGVAGGIACALLRSIGRFGALLLGCCGLGLLAAGLTALQYASSLERPQRSPFILFGLTAIGGALTVAHPLWSAIRYPVKNNAPQPQTLDKPTHSR